jgi:flagellar biosynthesis anti-sigma factor FlgM
MKVSNPSQALLQDARSTQRPETQEAAQRDQQLRKDSFVKTSSFTIDKLKQRVAAEPEIRADKVAELKAQLKNGEYQVDTAKLADKMLTEALNEELS